MNDAARSHDPAATPQEHRATAPTVIGCFVLTVSDTKTTETDTSGGVIRDLLTSAGHRVIGSAIVRDEPWRVQASRRAGRDHDRRHRHHVA